jgi:hypothetical protein
MNFSSWISSLTSALQKEDSAGKRQNIQTALVKAKEARDEMNLAEQALLMGEADARLPYILKSKQFSSEMFKAPAVARYANGMAATSNVLRLSN